MEDAPGSGHRRTVPVDPPVHVETFATHASVTWKADGLAAFLDAVPDVDGVPASADVVVDRTDVAGRETRRLAAVGDGADAVTYVRVEPPGPWTLSWERRTRPVVSVSGTPPAERCRDVHRATTDCSAWHDDALATLERLLASVE